MMRGLKLIAGFMAVAAVGLVAAGAWTWHQLSASLPHYEGEWPLPGLNAPVTVERDATGVVTIRSGSHQDEARALGYVHAQERFFQMDLLRRSAAGEMSALFGDAALDFDARRRLHAMRGTAERAVEAAPAAHRAVLEAYTEGVNAGLDALGAKPFEYMLLRTAPRPWAAADTMLVIAAMYFDLQGGHALHKRNELVARRVLPDDFASFLYPRATGWDTPLVGAPVRPASIPGPGVYDLRELDPGLFGPDGSYTPSLPIGSNNWAVHAGHSATGLAILANDMHLGLRLPNIWFRAALERDGRRSTGVTLPGVPAVVVGSNGRVAWGFTNSYGDWLDLIELELHPDDPGRYRTPDGWRDFEVVEDTIEVARGEPRELEYRRTVWGPVLGEFAGGTPYAVRWVAHSPDAYATAFLDLARAEDLESLFAAAHRSGIPAQNLVAADVNGDIGWTVMGRMPRRTRTGGGASYSTDGPAWDGWLEPDEYPVVVNPAGGRVWTANSRVVEGGMLDKVGDGNYPLGSRARQIRDRLAALDRATMDDMLAIQLDDEARFHARWNELLIATLEAAGGDDPRHVAALDTAVHWDGHAGVDAAGYRLVRAWRNEALSMLVAALTTEVRAHDPEWRFMSNRAEHWAWELVTREPAHLLDPRYGSWQGFRLAALDRALDALHVDSPDDLSRRTWGERNIVHLRHPLSRSVPFISRWLDMPPVVLPGDAHMPRVQTPGFGASQRMAVSPGDEANGYLHMPGGQSGHPRSPYYGAGHRDWVEGRPAPFLPGDPERVLELVPDGPALEHDASPAGEGSMAPNLARGRDGGVLMSWIAPHADGHALWFARHDGTRWSAPGRIATGEDWFVNWADFPAMAELEDGTLVAHWLEKSGPATYAYDVMVTRSSDGGSTWSAPESPHTDGTQTEHGFVSLRPVSADTLLLAWLDGRGTAGAGESPHRTDHAHGHGQGAMTLRARTLDSDGRWGEEVLLDDRVCDCCQTSAVHTPRGVTVAYRNRTEAELRDIWIVNHRDGEWREPFPLHEDGWEIRGCPVNGPMLDAEGDRVAAAWFTGAHGAPGVYAAFSGDGGDSFGPPVRVDDGDALGRVAVSWLDDGRALVTWLAAHADGGGIRARVVTPTGGASDPWRLVDTSASRSAGFPRVLRADGRVLLAWTDDSDGTRVRTAWLSVR